MFQLRPSRQQLTAMGVVVSCLGILLVFSGVHLEDRKTFSRASIISPPSYISVPESDRIFIERPKGMLFASLLERKQESVEPKTQHLAVDSKNQAPLAQKSQAKTPIVGNANRIVVPSIGIDIEVVPGVYDVTASSWQVDDTAAFHASTTVPVNDSNGTTLIYGHARWGIFGTLPDVKTGAEASVYTSEGKHFVYTFESVEQVTPDDTSMLTTKGSPKLILQTCSGFFDQYRTLAVFQLKEIL